ncbi:MAG: hypothetical protein E6767_16095 [Dysgonomonas sp.]|nr:hypothetical protein [Dysgonomonas sp.]
MRYILACLIFIILGSCQFKNTNQEGMGHAGFIMEDYPWTLDMDVLSVEKADSLFTMLESEHGLELSRVVIDNPSVKIKYTYGQYNEPLKRNSFVLNADNGKNFTAREILFKINNQTSKHLKGDPHYFFEGLEFAGREDGIPVYQIAQGS